MSVLTMERSASQNKYLHRDFHVSADIGIAYIGNNYGDSAVNEYLTAFALSYYKPLISKFKCAGLRALEEWILTTYAAEEASDALSLSLSANTLEVHVAYCPAVRFMLASGHEPSVWYSRTTTVVNSVIARECGLIFEMGEYDERSGKADYRFVVPAKENAGEGGEQ